MTNNTATTTNGTAPPQLVGMSTNTDDSRNVYNAWAQKYQADVEAWGYDLPDQVAALLAQKILVPATNSNSNSKNTLKILDAGCGDGLSGVALRRAGFRNTAHTNCLLVGADVSPKMLEVARDREEGYDKLVVLDLNQAPFPTTTAATKPGEIITDALDANLYGALDVISCVGTMTYVDPTVCLAEFLRWIRPGGYLCYTNRTDKLEAFAAEEKRLETAGLWKLVQKVGPVPYLPNHPDYGTNVQVVIFLYQKVE